MNKQQIGGASLFLGAVSAFLMIAIMEAMVPGYSINTNFISDLGTFPQTATLFTVTVIIQGAFWITGATLSHKALGKAMTALLAVMGIGGIGGGLAPENLFPILSGNNAMFGATGLFHMIFAFMTMGAGLAILLVACKQFTQPFSGISLGFAVVMAVSTVMMVRGLGGIGRGGMERLAFYPLTFWFAGLGAGLMGDELKGLKEKRIRL